MTKDLDSLVHLVPKVDLHLDALLQSLPFLLPAADKAIQLGQLQLKFLVTFRALQLNRSRHDQSRR